MARRVRAMTDARFPSRWTTDRRFARLPAEHFVSYMWALAYSVESGTDGRLEDADLMAVGRYATASTSALIEAGLFARDEEGALRIVDYAATQSTAAEVQAAEVRRIKERIRKRTQRAKRSASPAVDTTDQARAPTDYPLVEAGTPALAPWPTVAIPADDEPF